MDSHLLTHPHARRETENRQLGRAARWIPIRAVALSTPLTVAQFSKVKGINVTLTFCVMWITTLLICISLLITSSTKFTKLIHLPALFITAQHREHSYWHRMLNSFVIYREITFQASNDQYATLQKWLSTSRKSVCLLLYYQHCRANKFHCQKLFSF